MMSRSKKAAVVGHAVSAPPSAPEPVGAVSVEELPERARVSVRGGLRGARCQVTWGRLAVSGVRAVRLRVDAGRLNEAVLEYVPATEGLASPSTRTVTVVEVDLEAVVTAGDPVDPQEPAAADHADAEG